MCRVIIAAPALDPSSTPEPRAFARAALLRDLAAALCRQGSEVVLVDETAPPMPTPDGAGRGTITADRLLRLLFLVTPRYLWPLGRKRFVASRPLALRLRAGVAETRGHREVFALPDAGAFRVVPNPQQVARHAAVRAYYVDVVAEAVALAERWGQRAHWRERAAALAGNTAPAMPDEVLFPSLAGLGACARRVPVAAGDGPVVSAGVEGGGGARASRWSVLPPAGFDEAYMDAMLALTREHSRQVDVRAFGRDVMSYMNTPLLCSSQLVRLGWRGAGEDGGFVPPSRPPRCHL